MNLMYPTCANLRNEFRLLYHSQCNNLDKRIVKEFLGLPYGQELTDLAVKKCDVDKFKSMSNFLHKGINTREKTIELLAWLIDFPPRPFTNFWRQANGKTPILSDLSISRGGIVEEIKEGAPFNQEYRLEKTTHHVRQYNTLLKADYAIKEDTVMLDHPTSMPTDKFLKKEITLEYPSGVKINVDASDVNLIATLVRI